MSYPKRNRTPAELARVADRLRSERATATPVELDEIKLRAQRQAAPARSGFTRQKGSLMRSRLALTTMIVVGIMMSTTGVGLTIQGSSGSGNAAEVQYQEIPPPPPEEVPPPPKEEVPPPPKEEVPPPPQDEVAGQEESGNTLGSNDQGGSDQQADVPVTQQVAAAGDEGGSLPFTGFFTIPLMVGGVALLVSGAFLRRRSHS